MTDIIAPSTPGSFASDWAAWHEQHEAQRASEHGFLAVSDLVWLGPDPVRVAGIPGRWAVTGGTGSADGAVTGAGDAAERVTVTVDPAEDHRPSAEPLPDLSRNGVAVRGTLTLDPLAEGTGVNLRAGDIVVEVARRGGRYIVRPRHPRNPLRVNYTGTPTFEPSAAWRVAGRYVPFARPRPTTVGSVAPGLEHVYAAPGQIEFEVAGQPLSLTAFNGASPGSLFVLFTDATSGVSTYAANRSLALDPPDAEGSVLLDFNRATNLPCAYTDNATCPLPPAENRLPVAVEAGEQTPKERRVA
ncbi:DUF1684 domain-containing protein [Klugiella xanthotipulae]|uniref:DUF1684 domain-containing protein n=1 Tax=Klugiella xanthotipulae TaxID=244735 RepID=A0A543HZ33_9MICO|nr:DUF1684 domain-containing protein [Klugiella xanthotipulae]TQM63606.1 hypothetical protein FB466_1875 [Klugiella xanthotipulae]